MLGTLDKAACMYYRYGKEWNEPPAAPRRKATLHEPEKGGTLMKSYRFLVVGAHPDDADIRCGGLAIRLRRKGHEVMFLSMTDGGSGHQTMTREALVQRRAKEAAAAGAVYGVTYKVLTAPDAYLTPSLEYREMLMREIRAYAPDVIITHRSCDYHPDHRACGQLVTDCSYLVSVPLYCPGVPVPPEVPVILSMWDTFTRPVPFRADVAVPIDDVMEQKLTGMLSHVSQFYEWLPWCDRWTDVLAAATFEEKTQAVRRLQEARFARVAEACKEMLPPGTKYAEAFEWNEYGGPLTDELREAMEK